MNPTPHRQPKRRSAPRLPRGARWTVRGLAALPLIGLTVSAGVYLVSLAHLLRAHLVPIAAAELTRQTGHEVRIGGADFSRRGALVLTDIAIANKATFAQGGGEASLAARRLTVDYDLHSLIFDSGNAAHALGDIALDRPVVLVERYPGRFNFSDFFKPKTKKPTKPFVGRVLVHGGTLRFRDFNAPDRGKRPALNTLASIEGTADFFSERNVYFDVRGQGIASEDRFQSLWVSGAVSRQFAGRFRGHVVAANADAAYWTDYFKAFPQARIVRGRADADVSLARLGSRPLPGQPLDLSGRLAVRDATILASDKKILRLPLQNLSGIASFTGAGLSVDARVSAAGQPLFVSGTVFDFAAPQIAVSLRSPRLDPVRLAAAVPLLKLPPGFTISPGPVTASFTGTPGNPTITVSASLPAVAYGGNQATHLTAQATYANKVLSIPAATFRLNGTGQAALRGTVDTSGPKPVLLLAGAVRGVDLAALRLPPGVKIKNLNLGGTVNAQFLADNQGRPLSVVADVQGANMHLRATTLQTLAGRVAWTQGQPLTITRLAARSASGAAAVSGTVPIGSGQWNLNVRAAGLDLAGLLGPYSNAAPAGRASVSGKVVGPFSAPQFTGAARLVAPRFGRYSADLITGRFVAGAQGVRMQDVTLRRFPAEATINGTVTGLSGGNPALGLHVALSQGDIADFLRLAASASAPSPKTARALTTGLPNLSGTAEGAFTVGGTLRSPAVSGQARVADATVGGYHIDRAAAEVRYAGGVLHILHGRVSAGAATLTASGSRSASGLLTASFAATGLDLVRFHTLLDPYANVTGTLALEGSFSGTPAAPRVVLKRLSLPDLVVNRQAFAPLTLAGRYDDGVLTQTGDPLRLIVSVPPDYAADAAGQVEYDVNALRLVLPTPAHPRRPAALFVSAAIPTSAPERLSHVFATVRTSRFGRTDTGKKFLAQLARLPQPISGTFAFPRVTVQGPLTSLKAQAELRGGDLTLGDTTVAGLAASLAYTAGAQPQGTLTATAQNLRAAGVPIGVATADVDYRSRIITVHKLQATSDRAFLSASGTANLDGDIAASLDASNIPLALLGTALPAAAPALRALPREVSTLSVNASGPTRSPNLIGSISLSNDESGLAAKAAGKADTNAPAYALDRIRSGTITLSSASPDEPKVLTVTDLAAFKNGRLIATLSGSLPLLNAAHRDAAALLPDQDLHAVLNVQDLSALAGFAPGVLDPKKTGGRLSVSAGFGSGQLAGLATLQDASVGLTNFDTSVNKLSGIVVLGNNRATIQSFTGQSSRGGSFALTGSASLPGGDQKLNLRLTTQDLKLDEKSKQNVLYRNFSSVLKATINGAVSVSGPLLTPAITTAPGAPIVISEASGTLPSPAPAAEGTKQTPVFDPTLDVAVQLGGGKSKTVSVRGGLLQAEAGGPVRLLGKLSAPRFRADLSVARGQIILPPSTILKIVKPTAVETNTVTVNYPVDDGSGTPGVQTVVNVTAQATVSPSSATLSQYRSVAGNGIGEAAPQGTAALPTSPLGGGGRQRYTITAHIHGVLNAPDKLAIDLSSSPGGLSRSQMLAALVPASALVAAAGGGSGGGAILEDQFKTALANVAIPSLLTPITQSVATALGLEDVNVTYDPNLPLFVTVTKQIGPRLDVTFSRSFGARGAADQTLLPPQYTLKLGYSFTNRYRLGISTDERKNNTVTLESVLRF